MQLNMLKLDLVIRVHRLTDDHWWNDSPRSIMLKTKRIKEWAIMAYVLYI